MKVVFLGTPEPAVPSLRALLASEHEVAAVVTRPDKPRDRAGGRAAPSPVKLVAEAAGVPVLQPARGRDPDFPAALAATGAEIGVTCAFGLLLPEPVLSALPGGFLNVHFSLLPAYRGAAPVQRALQDGVTVTGVTIFQLDEGMDTGPVLSRAEVPVEPGENAGALTARLAEVGAALLVETLGGIAAGALQPSPQPEQGASHAAKVTSADARLDFTASAAAVVNAVRAFTPAPGAWTTLRGRRLKVLAASAPPALRPDAAPAPPGVTAVSAPPASGLGHAPAAGVLAPGQVALAADGGLLVGAADGPVRLERVQPDGKRPMDGADLARGLRPGPGERVGE
jgi:methionyl-tRNA formyltransferase